MPVFQYTIRDSKGTVRTGTSEATNQEILLQRLQEQGFTVNEVERIGGRDDRRLARRFSASLEEVANFWLLLSTLLESNVPLLRALELAGEQADNPRFGEAILRVRIAVGSGKTLSDAMRLYPKLFDKTSVGLIRAGEEGGSLKESVRSLLRQMETGLERRHQTQIAWIHLLTGVLIAVILGLLFRSSG